MEIAVSKHSQLGQYLAELDGETDTTSVAASIGNQRIPTPRIKRTERRRWRLETLYSELKALVTTVDHHAQLQAMGAVQSVLDAAWPEWREVHSVEVLTASLAHDSRPRSRWLLQLEPRLLWATTAPIVASLAYVTQWQTVDNSIGDIQYASVLVMFCVIVCVVFLQLAFQVQVSRITRSAQQLELEVLELVKTRASFEAVFGSSIDLVKKAELASRGYRIGTFLPPVARLEKPDDRLQCVDLRRLLLSVNEEVIALGAAKGDDHELKLSERQSMDHVASGEEVGAPSLLVTVISKRHAIAGLLLENTLHASLFKLVQHLWAIEHGESKSEQIHLLTSLRCQHRQIGDWKRTLSACQQQLVRYNAVLSSIVQAKIPDSSKCEDTHTTDHPDNAHRTNEDRDQAGVQLQELLERCETLKALLCSARHVVAKDSASEPAPDSTVTELKTPQWATELLLSRELIGKRVKEIHEMWEKYDEVLEGVARDLRGVDRDTASTTESDSGGNDAAALADQHLLGAPSTTSSPTQDDCTYVFTATSTGEKDFDLQAILRQHSQSQEVLAPTPSFVRELRDVLAYREAHARQTITKEIDRDAEVVASTRRIASGYATELDSGRKAPAFAFDLGAALKSELHGLLPTQFESNIE